MNKKIPFFSFAGTNEILREEAIEAFAKFFDSQWYVLGDSVRKFEAAYAAFCQTDYCVGTANGLDALRLSLEALGIGEGDEVIVPSNTYIASWLAISMVGATPIPAEPRVDTCNLNPELLKGALSERTKAIMPVHLYGQCCEMEAIMAFAKRYDLYVIEDNAQAQGASCNNQPTGSFGHINATSFYPGKNLGALGDAGAITTNDKRWATDVQCLRNYGSHKKYFNQRKGINSRLDEMQASFLSIKLKYLKQHNQQRSQIAEWYNSSLVEREELKLPTIAKGATSVYHIYQLQTPWRDALQQQLKEAGIGTLIHYPLPPHLQEAYKELPYQRGDFPIAERIADQTLSLPIYPGLTVPQVKYITDVVNQFFERTKMKMKTARFISMDN